jgi:hypothetical protein
MKMLTEGYERFLRFHSNAATVVTLEIINISRYSLLSFGLSSYYWRMSLFRSLRFKPQKLFLFKNWMKSPMADEKVVLDGRLRTVWYGSADTPDRREIATTEVTSETYFHC